MPSRFERESDRQFSLTTPAELLSAWSAQEVGARGIAARIVDFRALRRVFNVKTRRRSPDAALQVTGPSVGASVRLILRTNRSR
jgi:hypothetical protein